jgi:hypothetical protein
LEIKKTKKIVGKLFDARRFYSTRDVLQLFDLEYQRFRKWIDGNFIKPDLKAEGTGKTHYFERENLYAIGTYLKLVDAGINRVMASDVAYYFNWEEWAEISYFPGGFYVIVMGNVTAKKKKNWGKKMKIYQCPGEVPDLKRFVEQTGFELAMVVNLQKIAQFVESRLE